MNPFVHWSDWSQQPEIRIACTRNHYHPWSGKDLPPDIHEVPACEEHRQILYTFDTRLVTCPECAKLELFQNEKTRIVAFYAFYANLAKKPEESHE